MSHCVLSDWDLNVLDDGEEVAQRFGNRLHRQADQDCLVRQPLTARCSRPTPSWKSDT
jgi:hypothetical protein